ncbi:MAG: hypothetical protein E7266_06745 [Lachnospiraceae bacterium]|nr:hypothetical protein [Lachnospiraceae bacterium]
MKGYGRMLNEEKIKLMTKLAIYEKREGKSDFKITKYYRPDYVGLNVLNSAIVATFIYMAIVGAVMMLNIEELMIEITQMDLLQVGKDIVLWYMVFLVAYVIVALIVYNVKYYTTKKKLEAYDEDLRKLFKLYKDEEKEKERARRNRKNRMNGDDIKL